MTEIDDWREKLLGNWRVQMHAEMSGTEDEKRWTAKEAKKAEAEFAEWIRAQKESA